MACWFGFWVLTGFLFVYPALAISLRKPEWYKYAIKIRRGWLSWCIFWGGIQVEIITEEPLNKQTYVITPNHTSKLDMIILTSRLALDFNYAARSDFANIPLFGLFFKTIDIPVDMKDSRKAAISYKRALNQLAEGKNLVVYPEGTISRNTPKLVSFKEGAFRMAIEKQVDVLPITMIGGWELLPDNGPFFFKPGKVILYIHKPISTKGMKSKQSGELTQKVFDIIQHKLAEYGYA